MEQLKAYLSKMRDGFWSIISKIESSVLFEKLVSKYESLPTRNQKTIKSIATILCAIALIWFVFSPLIKTRVTFSENRSFFSLISSMKIFNSKLESSRKEFITPVGWQNIQANDLRQLEDSVSVIMAGLGLGETQYEVAPQGATLLVHASEATIKQLESFIFQMDGLYPRFSVVRNKTTIHPDNKELIQFEVEIAQGEVRDSSQTMNDFEDDFADLDDLDNTPPPPPSPGLNVPPPSIREEPIPPPPTHTNDGSVPGFEAPTFTPLDDEFEEDFAPTNPSDRMGGESEFMPPMGDDFIPPPPNLGDDTFDMVPIPEDDFPPQPPSM
jgi:hypothetical protein